MSKLLGAKVGKKVDHFSLLEKSIINENVKFSNKIKFTEDVKSTQKNKIDVLKSKRVETKEVKKRRHEIIAAKEELYRLNISGFFDYNTIDDSYVLSRREELMNLKSVLSEEYKKYSNVKK